MSYFASTILTDGYGFKVENTPIGEIRTADVYRLVGSTFNYTTLDANFWQNQSSGGTLTISGQCTLQSGTGNTTAIVQSVRKGRYTGGSANRYRAQVCFGDTGITNSNNYRRFGCYDGPDGAFFEWINNCFCFVSKMYRSL